MGINIAYYRVSTPKQGRSGLGLSAQKTYIRDYIHGEPDYEFTEVLSGKVDDREQLTKAIELCKKTNGTLLVANIERFSRNLITTLQTWNKNVKMVDVSSPNMSFLELVIKATLAQDEREKISKRTKDSLSKLKEKGGKLGASNEAYRESLESNGSTISENLAKARAASAKTLAKMSANNPNKKAIMAYIESVMPCDNPDWARMARTLNQMGIKSPRGCELTPQIVWNLWNKRKL